MATKEDDLADPAAADEDEHRRQILQLLEGQERTVEEIVDADDRERGAVVDQLNEMSEAGEIEITYNSAGFEVTRSSEVSDR